MASLPNSAFSSDDSRTTGLTYYPYEVRFDNDFGWAAETNNGSEFVQVGPFSNLIMNLFDDFPWCDLAVTFATSLLKTPNS